MIDTAATCNTAVLPLTADGHRRISPTAIALVRE
jgi:hypothetical protein